MTTSDTITKDDLLDLLYALRADAEDTMSQNGSRTFAHSYSQGIAATVAKLLHYTTGQSAYEWQQDSRFADPEDVSDVERRLGRKLSEVEEDARAAASRATLDQFLDANPGVLDEILKGGS